MDVDVGSQRKRNPYRGGHNKAPFAVRGNDLYQTPPEATRALLSHETFTGPIWEPACGPGAITRLLRSHGHSVFASDLVDYNSPDQDQVGWDFLMCFKAPNECNTIVTNPPFKLAVQFARHGLILCNKVVMLLRLAFIEGTTRSDLLDSGYLAKLYVFRNRLPMMHRAGYEGKRATSQTAFAWFVWDKSHTGPTQIHRISWGE